MLLKSSDLLFDPNAPFEWEQEQEIKKYVLEIRREERARKAIEPVKKSFEKPNVKVVFKLRGGNTEGNWSPYPDRALDARVIRYPLPRSAAFGKPAKGAPRPAR